MHTLIKKWPLLLSSSSSSSSSSFLGQVMGQVESVENQNIPETSTSDENSSGPSLDSLLAEAAAYGDEDGSESPDEKARRALDCPCVAHLRSGPCGAQFSEAFVCFLKSTAEEKGSDCVHPFVALQNCIKANPDAFSKDVLGDDEDGMKEKAEPLYKVRPPLWSMEPKSPKK